HERMNDECECTVCMAIEDEVGCPHPMSCMVRAKTILDTLPPRWDPRGHLPEDYEDNVPEDDPIEEGASEFDRRITTHGSVRELFRIF
ncbi:hypothetical protein BD311DRAFT_621189, partial [Dichomitus squalens]